MYLLARRWTNTDYAGALAGFLYVFNGVMFASFIWPNYLVTLGWMPFVVLLAEKAWREGGRWIVGASIVSALQMLTGAPEVILFTWIITGALCLCDTLRAGVSRGILLRRLVFVVILTAGLAAAQLLPFFELLQWSHRDSAFATGKWQLPLWGWGNFLVPLYNAFETPSGQYYQYDQGFLSSVYLGGVAITFMLIGLIRWPDVRVWVLFILAVVSLAFAFGDQTLVFTTVRDIVPLLGVARYPVKFLFILAFAVPLIAGCGLAAVVRSRLNAGLYLAAIITLMATLAIAWAAREKKYVDYNSWPKNFRENVEYSWSRNSPGKSQPDAVLNTAFRIGLFVGVLTLLSMSLRAKKFGPAFAFGSLALIAVDARTHTPKQNPTLPNSLFTRSFWTDDPKPAHGQSRAMITPQADAFLTMVSSTNAQRVWELKRRAQWSHLNLLDRVPKVNGSSTLQTREQRTLEHTLYGMTNQLPLALLDFLNVGFITSSNSPGEWSQRTTFHPFMTAGRQVSFVEDSAALASMTNETWNPQQTVFLPINARGFVAATNETEAVVSVKRATANLIEADIDAPAATVAVMAQSFYPYWEATLNDAPAPLLRANLAFQAVPVPAGKHRLVLKYSDAKFKMGAAISGATFLLCLLVWWRAGRSERAT